MDKTLRIGVKEAKIKHEGLVKVTLEEKIREKARMKL
jgi:hypothetical protein